MIRTTATTSPSSARPLPARGSGCECDPAGQSRRARRAPGKSPPSQIAKLSDHVPWEAPGVPAAVQPGPGSKGRHRRRSPPFQDDWWPGNCIDPHGDTHHGQEERHPFHGADHDIQGILHAPELQPDHGGESMKQDREPLGTREVPSDSSRASWRPAGLLQPVSRSDSDPGSRGSRPRGGLVRVSSIDPGNAEHCQDLIEIDHCECRSHPDVERTTQDGARPPRVARCLSDRLPRFMLDTRGIFVRPDHSHALSGSSGADPGQCPEHGQLVDARGFWRTSATSLKRLSG